MKEKTDFTTDTQHRKNVGILTGIMLITAFIVIALLILRPQAKGPYQVPPETGDGWETASLRAVGMEEEPIDELLSLLAQENTYNIHSLLVVKDGKLVLETYYPGEDITLTGNGFFTRKEFDRDMLHCTASASKSVTSLLVGLALDQGKISGMDEKMFASFPEYADLIRDGKGQITLRQMLTMTSGIPWDESYPYTDPRNDITHMLFVSPDPVRFVLERPLNARPGELWTYNSGTANLLGEIVHRRTGRLLSDYARDNLFESLGITSYEWAYFPNSPEMAVASSLLYLRPRDMAKVGQLILQQGSWQGKQIVSPEWIRESTAISVVPQPLWDFGRAFQHTGYGYLWWLGKFRNRDTDTIFAAGWGGQFIFIIPEINTVIVTTGSNYSNGYADVLDMVNRYVLGSVYKNFQSEGG